MSCSDLTDYGNGIGLGVFAEKGLEPRCPSWLPGLGQIMWLFWTLFSLCVKQKLTSMLKIPFSSKIPWCCNFEQFIFLYRNHPRFKSYNQVIVAIMAEAVEAIVSHRAGMTLWHVFWLASPLGHGLLWWKGECAPHETKDSSRSGCSSKL